MTCASATSPLFIVSWHECDFRNGSIASLSARLRYVRFAPTSGDIADIALWQLRADCVAKVAANALWNWNLKQSNEDDARSESRLRASVPA